jgi:hypothetical protein
LCAAGATVIRTRHRPRPYITPRIRAWFTGAGFHEVAFDALGTSALAAARANRLLPRTWTIGYHNGYWSRQVGFLRKERSHEDH